MNFELVEKEKLVGKLNQGVEYYKGERGPQGERGQIGPVGPEGKQGPPGERGKQGEPGKAFTYNDFTPEQLEALRGPQGVPGEQGKQGKPFTYADFTQEQLEALRGPQGIQGVPGETGPAGQPGQDGKDGKDFTYEDFTQEQLESLRGPQGQAGRDGIDGKDGKSFTYEDFTVEQLEALRGPQGEPGKDGSNGLDGKDGKDGISVSHTWNGTSLSITSASGTSEVDLRGPAGQDGYTPVKGVDYFDGEPGPAGQDYVLTDDDKQEIAGLVDLSGYQEKLTAGDNITIEGNVISATGGGSGSVAIDGTTIIQNEDGTISASIGGGKYISKEPESMYSYEDTTGFTRISNSNTRYVVPNTKNSFSYNIFTNGTLNTSSKYIVNLEFRNANTNETGSTSGYILYENSTWKAYDLSVFDDKISNMGHSSSQGIYLTGNADGVYQVYYITKFSITSLPTYSFNKIDSNYINIGNGLKVNGSGELLTNNGSLVIDDNNNLIQDGNSYKDQYNLPSNSICLGNGNSLCGTNGTVILGRNNGTGGFTTTQYAPGIIMIGTDNVCDFGRQNFSTCIGYNNGTYAYFTTAIGNYTKASSEYQMVLGKYNINDSASAYNFIIGNGADNNNRTNGLTIDASGNVAIQGTVSSAGADYAEYFEWLDGNTEAEDRVGLLVQLNGDKIELATGTDILGVVSGTATVLGDDAEWTWQGRYLKDDFGRLIMEEIELYDEEGKFVCSTLTPKVNPDYDPNKPYINRANRPEWDAIGMMGKLFVRDDGSAVVNGYVSAVNGIATASSEKTNMRVMERISENIIRVCLK